jgi:hypothetical protein
MPAAAAAATLASHPTPLHLPSHLHAFTGCL